MFYVWGLVFLRLGVSNSYVYGFDFLRLGVSFLMFGGSNSYLLRLCF